MAHKPRSLYTATEYPIIQL